MQWDLPASATVVTLAGGKGDKAGWARYSASLPISRLR